MPRLSRLAIAILPLALSAAGVAAQEPGRGQAAAGSRELRPRESLMQRAREPSRAAPPGQAQPWPQAADSAPPQYDSHSISEAVRRVQRTTGGQILGAEQVPFEGRNITRIKYMDERGRVRYMDDPGALERRAPRRADNDAP